MRLIPWYRRVWNKKNEGQRFCTTLGLEKGNNLLHFICIDLECIAPSKKGNTIIDIAYLINLDRQYGSIFILEYNRLFK